MSSPVRIWREVLHPTWKWAVLVPLAIISGVATVRDELIEAKNPELYRIAHWLPAWPWPIYAAVAAVTGILLIMGGAYRAIKRRDDLIDAMFSPERAIARLVELQEEGRRIYNETNLSAENYITKLQQWEIAVGEFIREHYSVAELHAFRSFVYLGGAQYTLANVPQDWLAATEKQRIISTSRIMALDKRTREIMLEWEKGEKSP